MIMQKGAQSYDQIFFTVGVIQRCTVCLY